MSKDMKVPKRRFKEFKNANGWEKSKLEHVASFGKGRGYSKNDLVNEGIPIILYGRLYTRYETTIKEVDTFVNVKSDTVFSKGGEVIIPASGETAEDIARASSVFNSGILLGGDLNIVIPNLNIDSSFLALSISNGKPQSELAKKAQGKSVVHIHNEDIKELTIPFPCKKEQMKVSKYFSDLDNLITLNQRKLQKLKAIEKAYLTQMFPTDGERKPKLRFAGFNDEWEKVKLNNISEITSGGTPSTSNSEYWDGDINWYSPAEIGDDVYAYESQRKITALGLEKSSAKMLPAERTILFSSRAGIGSMAILKVSAATNQGFQSIVLNKGYNTYFVYSMGSIIKKYAEKIASGSTFLEISGKQLGNIDILIPLIEEQNKIGELFNSIDNLVTLHQRKLEKLQSLKKAYLNEMFV